MRSASTTAVLGADGCPGNGWVVAELTVATEPSDEPSPGRLRWHHVVGAAALLELAADLGARVVAVDVPLGLPDAGTRACDVLARQRLKGGGASSVFAAPERAALGHRTYAAAREQQPSLSAQAFALVARIRDVDEALRTAGPGVHDLVVECHPEVSLRALTGEVLPPKKSAPGALRRLRALEGELGAVPPDAPREGGLDDALDALACAWTARRWLGGAAQVLGGERDATGVPMRIVV